MRNTKLIILVLIAVVFASCKKENKTVIEGKITHAENKTIYLEKLHVASTELVDSAKIDKNGNFKFTQIVDIPTFYLLKLSHSNFITLIVDSLDHAVIEADAVNFYKEYRVSGSDGSEKVKTLNDRWNLTQHKIDSIKALDRFYKGNPDYEKMVQEWNQKVNQIKLEQVEYSKNFVMENPFSLASILALYQKFDNKTYVINDLQTMRVAASALHSIYPKSKHVEALYQNTLQALKAEQNFKLQELIQNQGQNSPNIELPNPKGKIKTLEELRGKVVLVHFWSALDKTSRVMNESLVEAYKKYHKKGLEIYQVSVDTSKKDWEEAIQKDRLSWTNVGDMKGSNRAVQVFNIQKLPYNYLLDKEGVIIAQNLKGPTLDKTLAKILQ